MDEIGYQSPIIEGRRRKSPNKKYLIIAGILLLILIPVGIGGMQFLGKSSVESTVTPTPMPTDIAFPTDTPTPTLATPSATPVPTAAKKTSVDPKTGLNRATLRVSIQNGSGTVGAANKAATLLKDAGYTILETKNADNYDYQDVTIMVKPSAASYLPLLKQDILTEYTLTATDTSLSASSSADAVVIIGK